MVNAKVNIIWHNAKNKNQKKKKITLHFVNNQGFRRRRAQFLSIEPPL